MRSTLALVLSAGLVSSATAAPPDAWTSPAGAVDREGQCPEVVVLDRAVRFVRPDPVGTSRIDEVTFVTSETDLDGDSSRQVVVTPDGTQAVIVNAQTNTMTFLDIATRVVTHAVEIGEYPVDVAVTPDGQYALAPCVFSNVLSVVDIATHAEVAQVPLSGEQPYRVVVTPDGTRAIVGVINDAVSSSFSVVDLATLEESSVIDSVSQGVIGGYFTPEYGIFGDTFTSFDVSADSAKIVYGDRGGDRIMIYDIATGAELAALATSDQPAGVDVSPVGNFAVVSCEGTSRRVVKVDLATNSIASSFPMTADLTWQTVKVTPDGQYAIASQLNEVEFVNLTTGALTRLSTGSPGDIEFSADGLYAFVSNFNSRVISLATRTQVASLSFAACADAATSPTANIAVALNNRFGEDVHVYNISGPSSSFLGRTFTGPGVESDSTRELAMLPDGSAVFFGNCTSWSAGFMDMGSNDISPLVSTAFRTLDAAVSPDGEYVVVTSADGQTVSIIDAVSRTNLVNLPVSDRPSRVVISPDSAFAYVLTLAGTDRIHKIALNGASSSVVATQLAGQTGSVGYGFSQFSGIALSPDGSTLAVCRSFDDILRLIDTATMSIVADVPVNPTTSTDFPLRVAFHPDGTRAYVSVNFGNAVQVVNIAGGASSVIATISGIQAPMTLDLDESGDYLYVGTVTGGTGSVRVIATATNALVKSVFLPMTGTVNATHLSSEDGKMYVAGSDVAGGRLWVVTAAGPASAFERTISLSAGPADLAFSESLGQAVVSLPVPDGLEVVQVRDAACFSDYTGDTVVDILDFLDFIDDFSACELQPAPCGSLGDADFNGDTFVDILDFLDFIDAFSTEFDSPGCSG
jgi:YVTN family beta-propeller protein